MIRAATKVNPAWAVRLLALLLALAHVLLEGIASADGALLAEGVVLGRHGGGVVGVGLGRATPGSVVGDVTGVLGRGVGHLEGGEAALQGKHTGQKRCGVYGSVICMVAAFSHASAAQLIAGASATIDNRLGNSWQEVVVGQALAAMPVLVAVCKGIRKGYILAGPGAYAIPHAAAIVQCSLTRV